ncbi:TOBE domain-containing protein [Desulfosarcina ovata]|uniref:Putative molybdenum-pterin-binding protein n=2 Tax=Desulfosarcina ovata TaxID=83564 RepID=A0A5K8ALL1_9BACT|nr:TOBE domain-containing protein [Desulfosarcina ovata]BBO86489.1 putative molybdenum-pterin-binding protein [Desulfosarcina ovata subsp. sediminis]BBO93406.1 putative molybdenum-pterin-binding protein [Desulfosarcina ovata subsp. ovata]
MKLSTRNVLKGKVIELTEGMVMAKVKVDVGSGNGNVLTALISVEAAKELGVKVGEEITVMIKATSVMLATE